MAACVALPAMAQEKLEGTLNVEGDYIPTVVRQDKIHLLPQKVSFLVSEDGKEYTLLKTITTTLPITDEKLTIQNYAWEGTCEARYVRVQADINPEAGGFLFTDEIVVK